MRWWWWDVINPKDEHARSVLTLSVLLLSVVWYVTMVRKCHKGRSRSPPGPPGLPLLGNLLSLNPDLHIHFAELSRRYGPIFKLQLGNKLAVVVSSPSLAKEVLRDHDMVFANHDVPAVGRLISYGGCNIVSSPHGPMWRMLRRVCVQEMLSKASIDAVYALRRREVRGTVGRLYGNAGMPVLVGEEMFSMVMNVITSMLWGGTLEGEERSGVGAEFQKVVGEITELLGKPNVSDLFPVLAPLDLQGMERKMKGLFLRFDGIFQSIIDRRLRMNREDEEGKCCSSKGSKDFLQFLLKIKEEGDAETPLTMAHLKALLMDMVVGGTETTSNTLEWAMAHMINKPDTMRKARDELDAVVGTDSIVEESHVPKLHYLGAVMKEVLRLHPALPLLVPHCPSLTCTVGGYTVPKGARVFVNVWAIHRDPLTWANPSEFDPERFITATNKWDYGGSDFRYFPFGSGRRICAGIPMADRMVMYALASLLHSFEWRLPDGGELNLSEKFGMVLKKAEPLIAVPTPRLSGPEFYLE
ncbi:carnosic acid synthase-like [Magnolia sinica]|uniref:carnosic acid synthase-like n=1 Tax=Magnolia sinica TaxID=86752 RepID=UPI00265A1B8B|nr:carnosic acid synthase-like [Magnolia sinica]